MAAALPPPWWKRVAPIIVTGIVASVSTGAIVWNARPQVTPQVARFAVTLGSYQVEVQLARNMVAVSPDGSRLAYVVDRQLALKNLSETDGRPISGSTDPQAIFGPVFSPQDKTSRRVPTENSTVPTTAVFSPDGRWIAYTARESILVNSRVYVQPFPATGARYLVSDQNDDGHHGVWSRDGREFFYTPGPGNRIQKVTISTTPSFQFSRPETIARRFTNASPAFQRPYDVTRDGRFLGLIEAGVLKDSGVPTSQVFVVLSWFEELKRLVPTGNR